MNDKKNVLIVVDGAESMLKMAASIAAALKDFSVVTLTAGEFSGTQILPADICFFGVEAPNPLSFAYLNTMLRHINLAGRPCGVFSCSESGAEYLRDMVHDSELALHPVVLMEGKGDVEEWAKSVTARLVNRQNTEAGA
ncbi:MAG: hypothetical protein LBH35_07505 [Treponema sp.]|nr:hypothetical protein [Treponema sp.]